MKEITLILSLIVFTFSLPAQEAAEKEKFTIKRVEDFILKEQLDSAKLFVPQLKPSSYSELLSKIINGHTLTYKEYYKVIAAMGNTRDGHYQPVSDFINKNIPIPSDQKKIDLDYVEIKWVQTSVLRDQGLLPESRTAKKR